MLLRALPLVTGLLPIVAIHVSLVIAIGAGTIPACVPYIEGCASISAAGRYEPASFVFKPAMIAEAVIMTGYWLYSVAWLRRLESAALPGRSRRGTSTIAWLGCLGALFLIVYVTFLGTDGPAYAFMRRFGVYLYFAMTVLAQIALLKRVRAVSAIPEYSGLRTIADWQSVIVAVPFALGTLNLVLKAILGDPGDIERAIEWTFALLMHCYFILSWLQWRRTGFRAAVSIRV